jgi:small subunit ribosomal protein S17
MAQAQTAAPKARDIGIDVAPPATACQDPKCPFHGHLKVRGQQIVGRVTSVKMEHTVVVEKEHFRYDTKFERYERRSRKYAAHLPPCLTVQPGQEVRIMECRPVSKTVAFVVVEKRGEGA